jgi:sec-independent protein translocase protein TatA
MFLFIFDSPTQIIFVVVIIMLLFGASRLPQLAKSLGQSRRAFREGMREAEEEEAADRAKIASGTAAPAAPQITTPPITHLSDDELEAEMRRRAEARADH